MTKYETGFMLWYMGTGPEIRQCQIAGCKQYGRWSLYHTLPNRKKEWIDVCNKHEKEIGAENLETRGGYLTTKWRA